MALMFTLNTPRQKFSFLHMNREWNMFERADAAVPFSTAAQDFPICKRRSNSNIMKLGVP